jgi:hypothetical protein
VGRAVLPLSLMGSFNQPTGIVPQLTRAGVGRTLDVVHQ